MLSAARSSSTERNKSGEVCVLLPSVEKLTFICTGAFTVQGKATVCVLLCLIISVVLFRVFVFLLAAYKHADGKKIDGRRVLVDVERARTVKGWRPRRLGKIDTLYWTGLKWSIIKFDDQLDN